MSTEQVTYIISVRDRASKSLNKITKSTQRSEKTFNKLGASITRFVGAAAIGAVLKNSAKKIMEFEKTASSLSAITGATGEDLDFLKRKTLEFAAASTKGSKETLEGFKLIASAKPELLSNGQALANVTKEAITLSEASGLELPKAANALTSALNQFDLAADQSGRVINLLAAGSKFAAAEIPDLASSLEEFGGIASSLNISIEESAAAVETLSLKNLKGKRAGIQLKNVLLKLGSSTDKKINPSVVGLSTSLENLAGIQDNVTALTKMFGTENVLAAQTLIKQRKRFDDLTKSMTGTNLAYEQAAIMTDNLSGDLDRLGSSWEVFVINLNEGGGVITKALRNLTKFASDFLSKLDRINKTQKDINKANVSNRMQAFISGAANIKTRDDLVTKLLEKRNEAFNQNQRFIEQAEKLGGMKKVMEAGKGLTGKYNLQFNRKRELDRIALRDLIEENKEFSEKLTDILNDEIKLAQLLEKVKPVKIEKEDEPKFSPYTGITKTDKAAKKQISTITGAAPKTFNINIENLVEQFNVNTENITEGATEVKKQMIIALSEALADVQPITD